MCGPWRHPSQEESGEQHPRAFALTRPPAPPTGCAFAEKGPTFCALSGLSFILRLQFYLGRRLPWLRRDLFRNKDTPRRARPQPRLVFSLMP